MTELIVISSIMLVIIGIIVLAFVLMLFIIRNDTLRETMCTRRINATIKELKKKKSKKGWIYSPIYEYEFNGTKYSVCSKSKRYESEEKLGGFEKIYVNPYKPSQIYESGEKNTLGVNQTLVIIFIIAVVLLAVSILGLWTSGIS